MIMRQTPPEGPPTTQQHRLGVGSAHHRAHSVGPHRGAAPPAATHHVGQAAQPARPMSTDGCRTAPPPLSPAASLYQAFSPVAEYRTPTPAEFYAGVWQPPNASPRHSNVPSLGGYQAPEQPVYAPEPPAPAPARYAMSPPYTPATPYQQHQQPQQHQQQYYSYYCSPQQAQPHEFQTMVPPTPPSPYAHTASGWQQKPLPSPPPPLLPQTPYQAQQPGVAQPQHQPSRPTGAVGMGVADPPSFVAELPADDVGGGTRKHLPPPPPQQQQQGRTTAGKHWNGQDTVGEWAGAPEERFDGTGGMDGGDAVGHDWHSDAPAPLRIRKSTKRSAAAAEPTVAGSAHDDEKREADAAAVIHQHLWSRQT